MFKLAAIIGPTAVGKTELAIDLAEKIGGEIISCDSMQVYKGMDIGTDKANPSQQARVAHHLIDIVDPKVNFTVADYQKLAQEAIKQINERGRIPILVGGTGLYYQAVVDNYDFFPMEFRQAARDKWEKIYAAQGLEHLYEELLAVDRPYAIKIGPHDKKRIIRALEVFDLTGQPFSEVQTRNRHTYDLGAVGIYMERAQLYDRIEQRVDKMMAEGLLDEVSRLREQGCNLSLNSMQALGYKQVFNYLEGMLAWEGMLREIKQETRKLAKRQYTWFNKDKRIRWVNTGDYQDRKSMLQKICELLEGLLTKV